MTSTETILVVDDDDAFRTRLGRAFTDRGLEVAVAADAESAIREAESTQPTLVVLDLKLPGVVGLELLRGLRARVPDARVLVLTGYGSIATAVEAIKLGATGYLPKPADADEILAALDARPDPVSAPTTEVSTPSLARTEYEHIQRVLADCEGNVSEAARRLGLHRRSLQRKLGKFPPGT